jgi:hypothetical protein
MVEDSCMQAVNFPLCEVFLHVLSLQPESIDPTLMKVMGSTMADGVLTSSSSWPAVVALTHLSKHPKTAKLLHQL